MYICALRYYPPTEEKAGTWLEKHRKDVDIVANYLKGLEYDDAFFHKSWNDDNTAVWYEFEWHYVPSEEVRKSVRRLWRAGCLSIDKNDDTNANTIYFMIFSRTIGGVDCGIACTIDGHGTPKTQCQIRHEQIDNGWFYVYNGYEEWRRNPSQYEENQPWNPPY